MTRKRSQRRQASLAPWLIGVGLLVAGGLAAWSLLGGSSGNRAASPVSMPHIHGMGFSGDGRQLLVAAHTGLRAYVNGAWQVPDLLVHDYMGYAPTDTGFYSSGHPGTSGGRPNPLGLVRSDDGGRSLITLAFEGESDFHVLAVGYKSHAVYLLNQVPNSRLGGGVYYSLDDGQTWQPSALQGLSAPVEQLAVHPTDASIVAFATVGGLFSSNDHGDTVTLLGEPRSVTAVAFNPGTAQLLLGASELVVYDPMTRQFTTWPTPPLASAIHYLAINPVQPEQVALATANRDIYVTEDGGRSWRQIAREGQGQ